MSSVVISGNTSGTITLDAPAIAGTTTLTLPATSGTVALTASPTFTGQATIPTINLTGGQITFPATAVPSADANCLDDYEEGTYTPTITGSSSNPTVTGTIYGNYIKIGRQVTAWIQFNNLSYTGGSGDIRISLPFVCSTGWTHGQAGTMGPLYITTFPGAGAYPLYNPRAVDSSAFFVLFFTTNAAGDGMWTFANSNISTNYASFTITYQTA
jgi:hypothetical protein